MSDTPNPSRWAKGQSGNPNGRPKAQQSAAAQLSRYIDSVTNGGIELVDRLMEMVRDPIKSVERDKLRRAAIEVLFDRLAGKPQQVIEASIGPALGSSRESMAPLSSAELELLAKLDRAIELPDAAPVLTLADPVEVP